MSKFKDITGQRFGTWTVIAQVASNRFGLTRYACRCDCGKTRDVLSTSLITGASRNCGCHCDKHHLCYSNIPTHESWRGMIERCKNPLHRQWAYYGGRGIKVCDRWAESFKAFREDMGERPSGTTIDRINNDQGYEPGNCRWATFRQQRLNQKRTRRLEAFGESKTIIEWSEDSRCVVSFPTLYARVTHGWGDQVAISTALRKSKWNTHSNSRQTNTSIL